MNADHRLDTDDLRFPHALQSYFSGFNLLINGSSGSGKTNLLVSLLKSRNDKKNSVRRSFKRIFNTVIIISPSLKTLKDNCFDGLKHKFTEFNEEVLEEINTILEESNEDDEDDDCDGDPNNPAKTLLVMDDIRSMLKGGMK